MTVLSKLYINPQLRGGRKLLTNRRAMHAAVEASFPPGGFDKENERILWRVDSEGEEHALYVVSPVKPDFRHIVEQAGWLEQDWQSADYDRFLTQLTKGQQWGFRLTANPVKSIHRGAQQRGKVVPHVTVSQQIRWLTQKALPHGFSVEASAAEEPEVTLTVTRRDNVSFRKMDGQEPSSRQQVRLRIAQFDGLLTVEDPVALRQALVQGIGRAKAYGCGLLTLRAK